MRLKVLAVRFAASVRAFVVRVRQKVSNSRRQADRVLNSRRGSSSLVARTAFSSSVQARWKAAVSRVAINWRTCSSMPQATAKFDVGLQDLVQPFALAGGESV